MLPDRYTYASHETSERACGIVSRRIELYLAGLLLGFSTGFRDFGLSFFAQDIGFTLDIFGDVPYREIWFGTF